MICPAIFAPKFFRSTQADWFIAVWVVSRNSELKSFYMCVRIVDRSFLSTSMDFSIPSSTFFFRALSISPSNDRAYLFSLHDLLQVAPLPHIIYDNRQAVVHTERNGR